MHRQLTTKELSEALINLRKTFTPLIWIDTEELHRGTRIATETFIAYNKNSKASIKGKILEWEAQSGMVAIDWKADPGEGQLRPKPEPVAMFPKMNATFDDNENTPSLESITKNRLAFLQGLHENSPAVSTIILSNAGEFLEAIASDPVTKEEANTWLYKMTESLTSGDSRLYSRMEPVPCDSDDDKSANRPQMPMHAITLGKKAVTLIFVGPKPSDNVLARTVVNNIVWLHLGRPSREEHKTEINTYLRSNPGIVGKTLENLGNAGKVPTLDEATGTLSNSLMGLTVFEAQGAIMQSHKAMGCLDPEALSNARQELVNATPGLILKNHDPAFDMKRIIGLETADEVIEKLMSPKLPEPDRARSILLIGPPGCGKTMLGRGFAQRMRVPFIQVHIDKMLGGLMGDSERNLNRALDVIDSIGTCIAFFDEADKQLAGTSGENQGAGDLTQRLGGILLRWEQDRSSSAVVFKTANRTHAFSSEMLRRCDIIINVDFPAGQERRKILEMYATDRGINIGDLTADHIIKKTRYWSPDEIRRLVLKIQVFGTSEGGMDRAFQYIKPVFETKPRDIIQIRRECQKLGIEAAANNVDNDSDKSTPDMNLSDEPEPAGHKLIQ